jgi:hypothetical protein
VCVIGSLRAAGIAPDAAGTVKFSPGGGIVTMTPFWFGEVHDQKARLNLFGCAQYLAMLRVACK